VHLDPRGAADVLAALDAIEVRDGVPRIEAAEHRRLAAHAAAAVAPVAAPDRTARSDVAWTPHVIDGWYLGLRRRMDDGTVTGEAGRLDDGPVTALLAAAAEADAARVWLRGAGPTDIAAAEHVGWLGRRTLRILGRSLTDTAAPAAPTGLHLAPLAEVGSAAVARLLDRAYTGPRSVGLVEADPDAGPWTPERFDHVASVALADPADLLLAVDDRGGVVGAHWTGRRAGGVGEVFNLAVDPDGGGRGVGAWLLGAGLAHLEAHGHRTVVLWVDDANVPAVTLYRGAGFSELGRDVALGR
jgi:mycothiol synthase